MRPPDRLLALLSAADGAQEASAALGAAIVAAALLAASMLLNVSPLEALERALVALARRWF